MAHSGNHSGMCGVPDKRIRVALDNGNASGEHNFDVNDDDTPE